MQNKRQLNSYFSILKQALKKSCFSFVLIILSFSANSQLYKGQWLIGGSAAFSYSKANTGRDVTKISTLTLSPTGGYFFFNKFAGGLRTDFGVESYKSIPGHRHRITSFSVGPFVRYYFLPAERKMNLFADAGYAYAASKYTQFDGVYDESYHYGVASFKAGTAIFLNEHTALEITLGYNYSGRGPVDTFKTTTIQLGIGLQIHFGKKRD